MPRSTRFCPSRTTFWQAFDKASPDHISAPLLSVHRAFLLSWRSRRSRHEAWRRALRREFEMEEIRLERRLGRRWLVVRDLDG